MTSISELLACVAPVDDWQSHGEDEESVLYKMWSPYIVILCLPNYCHLACSIVAVDAFLLELA